jgi:hypothetical protein
MPRQVTVTLYYQPRLNAIEPRRLEITVEGELPSAIVLGSLIFRQSQDSPVEYQEERLVSKIEE